MTQRGLASLANQDHQTHTGKSPDEDIGEFTDQIIADQERQHQHDREQQDVPEPLVAVLEQADIVIIGCLEQNTHINLLNFLAVDLGKDAVRPENKHKEQAADKVQSVNSPQPHSVPQTVRLCQR